MCQLKQSTDGHKINRRFLHSFSAKLILMILLIVIGLFIFTAVLFFHQLDLYMEQSHRKVMRQIGGSLYNQLHTVYIKDDVNHPDLTNLDWNDPSSNDEVHHSIEQYIDLAAKSLQGYVWIVSPEGKVLFSTGFPVEMHISEKNLPTLLKIPTKHDSNARIYPHFISISRSPLNLFQSKQAWLSYVRPVLNKQGKPVVYLQIHREMDQESERNSIFFNSLIVTVFLSLILGVFVAYLVSKRLVRPLRELSDLAASVANGDFSVRIQDFKASDPELEILSNMDEVIALKRTFNNMVEQLDHMNTDRQVLISSVSHDVRTPLTSIKGFIAGLLDGTIPAEKQEHYLQIVKKETERLTQMVNSIHDMMLIETNGVNCKFKAVDVHELILDVIYALEPQILSKHLKVETDFMKQVDRNPLTSMLNLKQWFVEADEDQIKRVLVNLLGNAIKFVPEGGLIRVTTNIKYKNDFVIISIEDNGPGIPDADLKKIFDRFFKGDRSRTGHNGNGLGLYIAKKILAAHGQQITAGQGNLGGAKFSFTLKLI